MMSSTNSFKFFKNPDCEYYPCHNIEGINCLFCYCPLYNISECGGNFKMIDKIKDCSACILPHEYEKGYNFVLDKLK